MPETFSGSPGRDEALTPQCSGTSEISALRMWDEVPQKIYVHCLETHVHVVER
jgi:hypothetical protein